MRRAVQTDIPEISRLLELGFGHTPAELLELSEQKQTLLVDFGGAAVGTLRVTRKGGDASIYGFVVDPAWQRRGIGREALRRVCRQLRAEGARRVGLEVAVNNARALGLYTSIGFTEVTTEDYYALSVK